MLLALLCLHSFSLLCCVVCCVWCLGHKNATLPSNIRTNVTTSQFHPSLLLAGGSDRRSFGFSFFILFFSSVPLPLLYCTARTRPWTLGPSKFVLFFLIYPELVTLQRNQFNHTASDHLHLLSQSIIVQVAVCS